MFLFFKWLLASSSAAVCIWWNEHIKAFAALTKQRAGWLAGCLAGWLAGSYLSLQSTCWSDRLATKGPSTQESCQCCCREQPGQWSKEVAWAISHVPTRVQNAQKLESTWEHNGGNVGRKMEKGRRAADTCMCLSSFISGRYLYHLLYSGLEPERKTVEEEEDTHRCGSLNWNIHKQENKAHK